MELHKYEGKQVRIVCDDGQVFVGRAYDYISALDNTPEIASISIGHIEIYENEIVKIEII